jgi:nucleoside phosphorylase
MSTRASLPDAPERVDFAVMAIIPEGQEMVSQALGLSWFATREGYQWAWGYVRVNAGGSVSVVCGAPLDRENVAAGVFANDLLRGWRPRHLLIVDIGGGVGGRDGVALGDVVTHTALHYYDFRKSTPDGGHEPRILPLQPSSIRLRELSRRPRIREDASWLADIKVARPKPGAPTVREGEMLSGGTILARGSELDLLLARYPKVLAVEMEGAGAGRAILDSSLRLTPPEYLIVRGISDLCNSAPTRNQSTRDRWTRYAAAAAAAHAKAIVREAPASAANPGDGGPRQTVAPTPLIALTARLPSGPAPAEALGNAALELHRLAVVGPAGAGKSVALSRALANISSGTVTVFVALKRWSAQRGTRLLRVEQGATHMPIALDILLEIADADITASGLAEQLTVRPVLLVVDGINETTPEVAARIVETLDQAVRHWRSLAVLVADRTPARYEGSEKWTVAPLELVAGDVAAALVDAAHGEGTWAVLEPASRGLLALPFFLDLALRGSEPDAYTRAAALGAFITEQARIAADDLITAQSVTAAAYTAAQRFLAADAVNREVRAVLTDGGIVAARESDDAPIEFAHQLFGDFLSSRHLLEHEELWQSDGFDALTFAAESFDTVTLAAEQLDAVARGDRYLRNVYDWNWRAAVDCLIATGERDVFSPGVRTMVLGLLNERRSDPVDGTRRRSGALLARITGDVARRVAAATPFAARALLAAGAHPPPFGRWAEVYSRADDEPWTPRDFLALCDEDALLGWTVSYVLKRKELAPSVAHTLAGIYAGAGGSANSDSPLRSSIRWRVVFALGMAPQQDSLEILLHAFDHDPHPWVRWCSGRSITEIGAQAADDALAESALGALAERAPALPDAVAAEIAWVAQYHDASPQFQRPMRLVLEKLRATRRTALEGERWDALLARFDEFWSRPVSMRA